MPLPPAPKVVPMKVCCTRLPVDRLPMMLTPVPEIAWIDTASWVPVPPTMLLNEFVIRTPSPLKPLISMSCRLALPNSLECCPEPVPNFWFSLIDTPMPVLPLRRKCRITEPSGLLLGLETRLLAVGTSLNTRPCVAPRFNIAL